MVEKTSFVQNCKSSQKKNCTPKLLCFSVAPPTRRNCVKNIFLACPDVRHQESRLFFSTAQEAVLSAAWSPTQLSCPWVTVHLPAAELPSGDREIRALAGG
jgi:hypothetical protein